MLNRHYLDELAYLRDLGREFARAHPEIAGQLGEAGTDPDVERLLEGVAFIGARIRQKLDDEIPELTHALIDCFWPQWLCPLPATTVVQAVPARPDDRDHHRVARGATIQSQPVQGVRCQFRTTTDVDLPPVRIERVELRLGAGAELRIGLRVPEGLTAATVPLTRLRLHCHGPFSLAAGLHRLFIRHVTGVIVEDERGERRPLRGASVAPVAFDRDAPLFAIPGAAFPAHLALQEHLACPQRSLFVDLVGLQGLASLGAARRWTLCLPLHDAPASLPQVDASNLLLGCTVAVHLFEHDADPLSIDPQRREYRLQPSGMDARSAEIHSLVSAHGLVRGRPKPRLWHAHYQVARERGTGGVGGSFGVGSGVGSGAGGASSDSDYGTYLLRRKPAVVEAGHECWFATTSPHAEADEVLSLRLMCTNRRLPDSLAPGDLDQAGPEVPPGVRISNLAKPTAGCPADLGGGQEWRVIAQLTGNMTGLSDVTALRRLLELHHPRAHADQQARASLRRMSEALESFTYRPATRVVQGVPLRGLDAELTVHDDRLDGPGELHLLSLLLDGVLAEHSSLNCFTRLTVRGTASGEVLSHLPRSGSAVLR